MLAFIKAYKWFILPVAVLLVALIAYRATRPKVTVEAAAARTGPLSLRIAASGLVEADSADLSFQGSGRIMELYVKEGDRVRRSDVLARLAPMGAMPDTLGSVDVIHAPYDGSVVTIYQRRGAVVTPAQPVVRVVAGGTPWVTAFIESEDASYLQRGSMLRCRVGGYLSQSWDMQVIQIGREAVPRPDLPASSRQVRVRCRPTSAAFPLAAGTEVDVDGEVPLVSGATLIPAAAVVHENGGDWVWMLVDGQVSRRQVVIGPNNFEEIVIREGIQPGELVVVGGKMGVEEGMVVNVKPMPPMTGVRPGGD